MKKILLNIILLWLITITATAQPIGGKNSTAEVLGGLKIDSAFQLPPNTPFTSKGTGTTGRLMYASDSLPAYTKAGTTKKVLTKWDSGTVYVDVGEVGHANGVASLNSSGVVPAGQLPAITINGQVFVDTNQAQMLSHSAATAGALSVRTDSSSELFVLTTTPYNVRANWHLTQGNGVSAFNGRTGAITPRSLDYKTDSVPEGSVNLYFLSSRVQTVIATDTGSSGWVASQDQVKDTAAAIRSAISSSAGTLAQVLNAGNTAGKGVSIGKANSANPYQQVILKLNPADSSGNILIQDSTLLYRISGGASTGIVQFGITGGNSSTLMDAQTGSVNFKLYKGSSHLDMTDANIAYGTGNGNYLSNNTGVGTNQMHGTGNAPAIASGTGAGTAPTIAISGTDLAGYITLTTGTSPATTAVVATISFVLPFGTAPKCVMLTPANLNAASLPVTRVAFVNQADISTSSFTIRSNGFTLTAATQYQWFYTVIQ